MIAEIGHYALVLALACAVIQSMLPMWGAYKRDPQLMAVGVPSSIMAFVMMALSFAVLTYAYVVSDFSVKNVWENSHSLQPLLYKYTSVWGNHEGSMLLWVLILGLFGALVAVFGRNLPSTLKANVLGVQGWISLTFLLFILFTSNPFIRIVEAPIEGQDLNPILQDIGLAIHPPLLYLGYVGFSISFSFAIAALIDGRMDAAWARWVRPWTLTAWMFLTLGISMGSYWAYYELGWGGWWFWDPVENASFMPWLVGTALLHSAIVMEKRDALKVWTVLLAILTFSLSLLGTFLVRSGVLTSVHTFATDPTRGLFILLILIFFIGGALSLFAIRASTLRQGGIFAPISREGGLVLNNLFLTTACATVLIGTLYPLALESVTGEQISVGAPFFNLTFGPLILPILIAIPFGQLLAWKRGDLMGVTQRLYVVLGLTIAAGLVSYTILEGGPVLAALGIGLAVWLMLGSLWELVEKGKLGKVPFASSYGRLKGLPRATWGMVVAHFGLGMAVLGVVMTTSFQTEAILVMKPGETTELSGYSYTYNGGRPNKEANFEEIQAGFTISRNGVPLTDVAPSKRVYIARQMPTTEAAIVTLWSGSQLYVSLGDQVGDNGMTVRLYYKPLITYIWIGSLVMFFGGFLSLTDRRLRVGAPKQARNKTAAAPAPAE